MLLDDLPDEVIENVFIFLNVFDVLNLSECSRKYRNLCSNDRFWKLRAKNDYEVELNLENLSSRQCRTLFPSKQFYMKILQPLGPFLFKTFVLCNHEPYGGLMKIIYHDWRLCVVILHPPSYPNTHHPLQPEVLFSIGIDDPTCDMRWKFNLGWFSLEQPSASEKGPETRIRIRKQRKSQISKATNVWKYNLQTPEEKLRHMHEGNLVEIHCLPFIQKVLQKESLFDFQQRIGLPIGSRLTCERFDAYKNLLANSIKQMISIDTNSSTSSFCPINSGLYKGAYGAYGIGIINVFYEQDGTVLIGRKITGDEVVYCSDISFRAFVDRQKFDSNEMHHHSIDSNSSKNPFEEHKIKFELPVGCEADVDLDRDVFRYEIGRFPAKDAKSWALFRAPTFMECTLVVFTETIFGVIWLDLKSMSVFERVKEDLTSPNVITKMIDKLSLL